MGGGGRKPADIWMLHAKFAPLIGSHPTVTGVSDANARIGRPGASESASWPLIILVIMTSTICGI
jgi:hypothetical protein